MSELTTEQLQSRPMDIPEDKGMAVSEGPTTDPSPSKPLSEREYKLALKKAQIQRDEQIKENRRMIQELNLEVSYWQAQVDLLRLRYEKMDYTLKNMELEPKYLQAMEAQKAKEEQSQILS